MSSDPSRGKLFSTSGDQGSAPARKNVGHERQCAVEKKVLTPGPGWIGRTAEEGFRGWRWRAGWEGPPGQEGDSLTGRLG